ncbi:MAG: thiamine-phosphate kinase [Victivallales bacterium]|jgi:thiamine-monophosphate kinase
MKEKEIHQMIYRIFRQGRGVAVGPGDDCAALDFGGSGYFLAATDQLVSDVHYIHGKTSASAIAKKLFNRNISDIAAMGGAPAFALLAVASHSADKKWYSEFIRSIQREASKWDVSICGGDISSVKKDVTVCTLTINGWVEKNKICLRSNAKPGDILYATGLFGNSFRSGHHLSFSPRIEAARFIAGKFTRAMIDVSDGFLVDAQRLASASGVGLVIDTAKIPLRKGASLESALSEGEDYELLFAVPSSKSAVLREKWPFKNIRLTRIGNFTCGGKGRVFDLEQRELTSTQKTGFDHFDDKGN